MTKPILPRLTLFTGGIECSLCTVAKEQLEIVRQRVPFDLQLFNIRKVDGEEAEAARERKKWRRMYHYDIPVLHMDGVGRVMKHRIDDQALEKLLQAWRPDQNDDADDACSNRSSSSDVSDVSDLLSSPQRNPTRPTSTSHPSRLPSLASTSRLERSPFASRSPVLPSPKPPSASPPPTCRSPSPVWVRTRHKKKATPPWRLPLGRVFFALDSTQEPFRSIESQCLLSVDEEDAYAQMIADTFSSFSIQVVGAKEMILPYDESEDEPEVEAEVEDGEVQFDLGWVVDKIGTGHEDQHHGSDTEEDQFGYRWIMEAKKTRGKKKGIPGSSTLAYDRAGGAKRGRLAVLGAGEDAIEVEAGEKRGRKRKHKGDTRAFRVPHLCWNCSSPDHKLTECPRPRDRHAINAGQKLHETLKKQQQEAFAAEALREQLAVANEPEYPSSDEDEEKEERYKGFTGRFWDADVQEAEMIALLDRYQPGQLSDELKVALSHDGQAEGPGTSVSEVGSWIWSGMAKWGYPPGWSCHTDPREKARLRIQPPREAILGPTAEDDEPPLQVYGATSLLSPLRTPEGSELGDDDSASSSSATSSSGTIPSEPAAPSGPPIRWATYPTSSFSSQLLPVWSVANPVLLPPIEEAEDEDARRKRIWEELSRGVRTVPSSLAEPKPSSGSGQTLPSVPFTFRTLQPTQTGPKTATQLAQERAANFVPRSVDAPAPPPPQNSPPPPPPPGRPPSPPPPPPQVPIYRDHPSLNTAQARRWSPIPDYPPADRQHHAPSASSFTRPDRAWVHPSATSSNSTARSVDTWDRDRYAPPSSSSYDHARPSASYDRVAASPSASSTRQWDRRPPSPPRDRRYVDYDYDYDRRARSRSPPRQQAASYGFEREAAGAWEREQTYGYSREREPGGRDQYAREWERGDRDRELDRDWERERDRGAPRARW